MVISEFQKDKIGQVESNLSLTGYQESILEPVSVERSLDALPFYVMLIDANHRILYANSAMCQALKLELKDIIGKNCPQIVHGVDHFAGCPLEKVIDKNTAVEDEVYDSNYNRWLKPAIYPTGQSTEDGEAVFLHLTYDIDEQKRVSQELELKARLLDAATDSIFLTKPNGEIIFANENACETRGYARIELIGLNIKQLRASKALKNWDENRKRTISSNEIIYETRHRRKNGTTFPVEVHAQSIERDREKKVLSVVRDITRRKLAEKALKNIEERHRSILVTAMDGFWMVDLKGRLLEVNETYSRMSGYSVADLECMTIEDLEANEVEEQVRDHIQEICDKGDSRFETKHRRKDGSVFDVEVSAQYQPHEDGYIVVFIRDITDKIIKEAENRRYREKSELSSRLAAVGEMAAGIAHEINNPLTSIIGFAELLSMEQELPENAKEEVRVIYEGSQRVKDIVARLLTFARQSNPEKIYTDISEVIDNTLGLRSYVLKTANINVEKIYASDLPGVMADAGQLQQVFLNLIVNAEYAMKKTNDRGTLTIQTKQNGNFVQILVKDDGPGIDEEIQNNIFQPFFTTKQQGEGTGLGLSLSYGIVQEHGGTLAVESKVGQGSTFIIELPVGTAELKPKKDLVADASSELAHSKKQARVLVVDDEPFIRTLIQGILVRNGHTFDLCENPLQALERVKNSYYDLLLLDVRMPGMSGMELFDKITAERPEMADRVIFITGDTSDPNIAVFVQRHKLPVITKPFSRKDLEVAMNGLLSDHC